MATWLKIRRLVASLAFAVCALLAPPSLHAQGAGGWWLIFHSGSAGQLVQSINADGWSAVPRSIAALKFQPDTAPQTITVNRVGYTTNGTITTYSEQVPITAQVRYPYPSQASLNPSRVALAGHIYTTDTIAGVQNNSALAAPMANVAWAISGDRRTIYTSGNALTVTFVASNIETRNQAPTPYATCTASDGTHNLTVQATGPAILADGFADQNPVIGYSCAFTNMSATLAAGQITVNASVYPWIGASGSINTSGAGDAQFATLTYTLSSASRYYAYANGSTGNDSTCVASTTASTAAATPCLTEVGAANKCYSTAGDLGKCNIRLTAGTYVLARTTVDSAATSEAVIEIDPAATAGSATLQFGASGQYLPGAALVRFSGLKLQRTGVNSIQPTGGTVKQIALDNVALDGGSTNSYTCFNAANGIFANGVTYTNPGNNCWQWTSTNNVKLIRGMTLTTTGTQWQMPMTAILGSNIADPYINWGSQTPLGNVFIAFDKFMNGGGSNQMLAMGSSSTTSTISRITVMQSIFEWTNTNNQAAIQFTADPTVLTSANNALFDYVTVIGANLVGRTNWCYDNNSSTAVRIQTLCVIRNSILSQANIKSDIFVAVNGSDPTDAPLHTGNWDDYYGVNHASNWFMYADAAATWAGYGAAVSFSQAFGGLNLHAGHSNTAALSPGFNAPAAVTWNGTTYTAGGGNGDYTLPNGAAAKGNVKVSTLPFDLAGAARPATGDSPGAYR